VIGHSIEFVLRTLHARAGQIGIEPGIQWSLRAAADAMQDAWTARRAIAAEWDIVSTGSHQAKNLSPVAAEIGDLVLRAGRLAYRNPDTSLRYRHRPRSGRPRPDA
jgi:hypothetical protein